jgi:hypothetical protein
MEWTGGCMCGAVRYEASEPPQQERNMSLPHMPTVFR